MKQNINEADLINFKIEYAHTSIVKLCAYTVAALLAYWIACLFLFFPVAFVWSLADSVVGAML